MSQPSRRQGITVNLGRTEVTKLGVTRFSPHDAFHLIMSLTWAQFFAGAVTVYLLANLVFASLYSVGDHAINNATRFSDCFFFSVETMATVGYGSMSPAAFMGTASRRSRSLPACSAWRSSRAWSSLVFPSRPRAFCSVESP